MVDFDKLAEVFEAGARFMDEDEILLLASAVETVVLEKNAGNLEELGEMSEVEIIEFGARVADEVIKRSS